MWKCLLLVAGTAAIMYSAYVIPLNKKIEREQSINSYVVKQLNKISAKAKAIKEENQELRDANEALLGVCNPQKADRVIPLPKLKVAP